MKKVILILSLILCGCNDIKLSRDTEQYVIDTFYRDDTIIIDSPTHTPNNLRRPYSNGYKFEVVKVIEDENNYQKLLIVYSFCESGKKYLISNHGFIIESGRCNGN